MEGESAESRPSIAVRPNEPLPEGWKELFNVNTGKVCWWYTRTREILVATQLPHFSIANTADIRGNEGLLKRLGERCGSDRGIKQTMALYRILLVATGH